MIIIGMEEMGVEKSQPSRAEQAGDHLLLHGSSAKWGRHSFAKGQLERALNLCMLCESISSRRRSIFQSVPVGQSLSQTVDGRPSGLQRL